MGSVGAEFCLKGAEWRGLECGEEEGGIRRESSVLRVLEIELLGKSPRATMATMPSELVGKQCRPDLLDAPITIKLFSSTQHHQPPKTVSPKRLASTYRKQSPLRLERSPQRKKTTSAHNNSTGFH